MRGSETGSLDPSQSMLDAEAYIQAAQTGTRFTFYLRGHAAPRGNRLVDSSHLPEEYSRGRVAAAGSVAALWSDGRRITADDFVYAWRRIKEPSKAVHLALVFR